MSLRAAIVAVAATLLAPAAQAACPSSEPIISELTCSSTITGTMAGTGTGNLQDYSCGDPYSPLTQGGIEDVYEFTCQTTGSVTMNISGLSCDFDIYILDSTCDPDKGCEAGSTEQGTKNDSITFACTKGDTYYVVIEGYGYSVSIGPGRCSGAENYTLGFDLSSSTACNEDCDDGKDNDFDGDTDCDDSDCSGDPVCTDCDTDGDGYIASGGTCGGTDCNDTNASVNPGATETCNGVDDDCDGTIDEGVKTTWYRDSDGDTYGDASSTRSECTAPSGYVANSSDCDDTSALIKPGGTEICNSKDDDCDGSVDEGIGSTWYRDSDGDGYGGTTTSLGCTAPTGYVATTGDCNDADKNIHPGATEICNSKDDDCDGTIDEGVKTTYYRDSDGDSFGDPSLTTTGCAPSSGYVADNTDCDDKDATTYPGAPEICDGIDNDCDGVVDDGATGTGTWYADDDSDGYGDPSDTLSSCERPTGYVNNKSDCNDADATIHPGATEVPYDGIDQDCDGADLTDVDGDTYDWDGVGGTDCDDTDPDTHPGAVEVADGRDQDCDGIVDEGTDHYDDDGDGYTELGGDCDDADDAIAPPAIESCDSVDEDCDGTVDEGTECYDDDGDGFTETDGDCNDGAAAVNPDATEVAENGIDDDCDGLVDDGTYDADGDGYTVDGGDCDNLDGTTYPGAPELADGIDNDCDKYTDEGTVNYDDDGDGMSEVDGDCDDSDSGVYEGATEVLDNGIDDDCDGVVDDGGPRTDDDGDGFTEEGGDCDDGNDAVNPAEDEVANGVDDDCDGAIDEGADDEDGDGYTLADGDCDDREGWTHPNAVEFCDGIDNDCDDETDETCGDTGVLDTGDGGCGCSAGGLGAVGLFPWLGLVLVLRRRRV